MTEIIEVLVAIFILVCVSFGFFHLISKEKSKIKSADKEKDDNFK